MLGWSVLAQGPAFDISDSIDEYPVCSATYRRSLRLR